MENCCYNCKHWQGPKAKIAERIKDDLKAITWSEAGECKEIKYEIDINLCTGPEGAYVESIETDPDFYCNLWKNENS